MHSIRPSLLWTAFPADDGDRVGWGSLGWALTGGPPRYGRRRERRCEADTVSLAFTFSS